MTARLNAQCIISGESEDEKKPPMTEVKGGSLLMHGQISDTIEHPLHVIVDWFIGIGIPNINQGIKGSV